MPLSVDLFWSFRSPYSYLALDRACALAERFDLDLHARPVYPLAVRDPDFFQRTDGWDQGDHLGRAIARAGLDPQVLAAEAERDAGDLEALIADNERAHAQSGHWGVPTFVFNGEPFFGQDRIELLLWRLQQHGLQPRHLSAA